jgi:spore coat polysaccharide biosynthesis protein SpsF
MRALRLIPATVYALVTDAASAPLLAAPAAAEGFEVFIGSATDVLARYQKAAAFFQLDTIVRATGDNPLVSPRLGNAIIAIHLARQADLSHYLDIPLGTGIEVISHRALEIMAGEATDPYEHEHMTTYIYRHRETFKVVEEPSPKEYYFPEARVSVDTPADYERISHIYEALYLSRPIEIDELTDWLRENDGKANTAGSRPPAGHGDRTSGQVPLA